MREQDRIHFQTTRPISRGYLQENDAVISWPFTEVFPSWSASSENLLKAGVFWKVHSLFSLVKTQSYQEAEAETSGLYQKITRWQDQGK